MLQVLFTSDHWMTNTRTTLTVNVRPADFCVDQVHSVEESAGAAVVEHVDGYAVEAVRAAVFVLQV